MRFKVLVTAAALGGALALSTATPAPAADTFPSQDACKVINNNMPSGNCGPFIQTFKENFNGDSVPLGSFSDCNHNVDTKLAYCGGLSAYPQYYANWWAYPSNWDDTAKSGADGNDGAPYGGVYRADKTVSVVPKGYDGTGVMRVDMYRPATGEDNYVAAVVPKKCMQQKYGKYSERLMVTRNDGGFKSAHLFYEGGQEVDYPENDYGAEIAMFTHPQGGYIDTNARWTTRHTYSMEWTPAGFKFFLDGKLLRDEDGTSVFPSAMPAASWILQNESSIEGPYAARGAHAIQETTWVTCYKYQP